MAEPYIVFRRFKGQGINGPVNLRYGELVERKRVRTCGNPPRWDDFLAQRERLICAVHGSLSHGHFSPNSDGCGLRRGRLCQGILARLERRDPEYQARWDKVWQDPVCQRFQRPDHPDHWLWSDGFFEAGLDELEHIARLVGAKAS